MAKDKTPDTPPKNPSGPQGPDRPLAMAWKLLLIPFLLLAGVWAYGELQGGAASGPSIAYTTFYQLVEEGKVERVTIRGDDMHGRFTEPQSIDNRTLTTFRTRLPPQSDVALLPLLRGQRVAVEVEDADSGLGSLVALALPWALILGAWVWISRRAQRMVPGGFPGGLTKPTGRKLTRAEVVDVSFDDVAGLAAAKRDLREVVDFLKDPTPFQRLGGKLPRGLLLVGSPGTGKTLLARAVAGEAGVPFFSISASEFIELFVGVGAARVRDLFAQAKKEAPAIIFIDEIDAVGRSRGTGFGGGHDEREQTLNQLLAEMDGFERSDRVVVLAATNRPDVLDPALLRPGRFDRRVVVDLPEIGAREAILAVHTRDKPLADDVSLAELAAATPGFSGADLANLCNEAALGAVRRGAERIERKDFLAAQDKIQLGDPRETRLSPEEKQRVAVHEAGHAVTAHLTPGAEPLRRVTIIPRGLALGATQQQPGADKHLQTKSELKSRLRVLLGGYAAEKLFLSEVSSGAANDLRQASALAEKMVAQLGMSEALGPVYHEHKSEHPFLGARMAVDGGVSDATLHLIEAESQRLLETALAEAEALLEDNRALVERLVARLMSEETLERDDLERVFGEVEPPPERVDAAASRGARVLRLPGA